MFYAILDAILDGDNRKAILAGTLWTPLQNCNHNILPGNKYWYLPIPLHQQLLKIRITCPSPPIVCQTNRLPATGATFTPNLVDGLVIDSIGISVDFRENLWVPFEYHEWEFLPEWFKRITVQRLHLGNTVCPPCCTEVRYPITVPTHSSLDPWLWRLKINETN